MVEGSNSTPSRSTSVAIGIPHELHCTRQPATAAGPGRPPRRPGLRLGHRLLYSLTGTAIGRVLFPQQATGSIATSDGKTVGSSLIAQAFADPRYFQPRPSAAGYDPMAAAGSNQARTNPDLRKRIEETTAVVAGAGDHADRARR